ncbi:MAG: hypothetical protein Q9162_004171 [Coniocarpon cinnabarinum]
MSWPQQRCPCVARLPFLALGSPTSGRVDLATIVNNGESLTTAWTKAANCRACSSDPAQLQLFYLATQRQVAMYEAAAKEFGFATPSNSGSSTPVFSTSIECIKTPASLGDTLLDQEEGTALGRAILSKAYADFFKYLSQLGLAFRRMSDEVPMDEPEKAIHEMTGRLLKCITKTRMAATGVTD